MDIFRALEVSATGLAAQQARMEVIAENLANSDTTRGPDGRLYRRKVVRLEAVGGPGAPVVLAGFPAPRGGVRVAAVVEAGGPPRRLWQPGHPAAGPDGFVDLPDVNPLLEMVDMMAATRAWEANAAAFQAARTMVGRLLDLLR
jgi:flagellar basal-body rod protein FlgC